MSTEANKQRVRRYYEEVVNTGEVRRLPEFIAPDYVEVYRNTKHPVGLDGARAYARRPKHLPGPASHHRAANRRRGMGRDAGDRPWDAPRRVTGDETDRQGGRDDRGEP